MAKKKVKAGKFQVPPELAPGVYRNNVGFFEVGDTLTLPDAVSEKLREKHGIPLYANPKLIPLNETAVKMQAATEDRRVAAAKEAAKNPPKPVIVDPTERLELPGIPKEEDATVEIDDDDEVDQDFNDVAGDLDYGKPDDKAAVKGGKGGKAASTRAADR